MEQLINITDAVFLGHVGEIELGASAIAGIYYLGDTTYRFYAVCYFVIHKIKGYKISVTNKAVFVK